MSRSGAGLPVAALAPPPSSFNLTRHSLQFFGSKVQHCWISAQDRIFPWNDAEKVSPARQSPALAGSPAHLYGARLPQDGGLANLPKSAKMTPKLARDFSVAQSQAASVLPLSLRER
jgi:hypothetical protein